MEDYAGILRRLWDHEKVSTDGPAGHFPEIDFGQFPEFTPPPLLLAAMGPRTLALVGRAFDGVLLHPFLTTGGVARSREIVREAAVNAGRDPDAIRIHAQVVSTPDMSDEEFGHVMLARAAAYFVNPGFMESVFDMNGWDLAPLVPFREEVARAIKENEAKGSPLQGREMLVEPGRRALREEWWKTGGAVGTAAEVAARLHQYVDAGADNVIVHGVTPDRLAPTVEAFAAQSS
jgi:alkanesulfonate monooxygenase SsuD/methylene tetrahydromethanopterin reductase-like flavin-dependent oxidoreductase (luciferase family)